MIVGASSPILQDLHATSTTGKVEMPGPEIWANAASSLLQDVPLTEAPGLDRHPPDRPPRRGDPPGQPARAQVALAAGRGGAGGRVHDRDADCVQQRLIWTFVFPLLALAIGTLGTLAVLYVGEAIERERVRDMFSRFVPGDVVDQVLESANENLRLGGVERDCTILFQTCAGSRASRRVRRRSG